MEEELETLRFVRAGPHHVGFMAELARDEVEAGLQWTWHPTRIARSLARNQVMGVVAKLDDLPAGFCLASYGTDRVHLLLLGVDIDARRMGIGRRLVGWHERCALVAGSRSMTLELRSTNKGARDFYLRLGFEVAGRRRRYYQGREDALLMHRELTPISWG